MKKKYLMVAPLIGALMLTGCDKTPEAETVSKEVMKENLTKTKKLVDAVEVKEKGLHLKGSQTCEISGSDEETTISSTAKLGFEVKALTDKVHMHFDANASGTNKTAEQTLTQSYSGNGDAYASIKDSKGDFAIKYSLKTVRGGSSKEETFKKKATADDIELTSSDFADSLITMGSESLADLSKELFESLNETFTAQYNSKNISFKYGSKKSAENYTIDGTTTATVGDLSFTTGERLTYVFDSGIINKFTAEVFATLGTLQVKLTSYVEFETNAKDFSLPDFSDYDSIELKDFELPDIGQSGPAK